MTEPLSALHALAELPPTTPPPVEDLRRRVATRSRRRHTLRVTLVGAALVLAGVAVVPLVDRPSHDSTQVVAAAVGGLPEVAQAPADGSTLVLLADANCAYLHRQGQDSALGGGCATRPADHSVQTFGPPVELGDQTATILRGGPAMARYSARLADGRTIDGALGAHGWAMVVTDGRMVGVSGFDARGVGVPEWIVR